jgi:DNA-directed RNA polymerase specialized sigma24 family protein
MTSDNVAADAHEVLVERDERTARMRKALLAMSERERQVLIRHRRGWPISDIARDLGFSQDDARCCLQDALAKL